MGRTRCRNGHLGHPSWESARSCEASARVFDVHFVVTTRVLARDRDDAEAKALFASRATFARLNKTMKVGRVVDVTQAL